MKTRSQTTPGVSRPNSLVVEPRSGSDQTSFLWNIPDYCDKLRNRKKIYDVDFDFDEASKAWLQNKKRQRDGCYTYTS